MRKPISGLRRMLFRAPIPLFRLRLGWIFGHRLLLLTHTGRTTGIARRTVLEVPLRDAGGVWYLASGWGRTADWYRNLSADPRASITVGTSTRPVRAELLTPTESGDLMARYATERPSLARALARTIGWTVGGSTDWYRLAYDEVPWVRLIEE